MIAAFCCGAPLPTYTGPDNSVGFEFVFILIFAGFCLGIMLMAVIQYHRKH